MDIAFNKPYLTGKEITYIRKAVKSGKTSGNGKFTKLIQEYFQHKYGFQKVLLTTTCTHALEMAGLLLEIKPGDEIIMPSFTFVSTANAFVLRGAKIVFADSNPLNPNLNEDDIEALITKKTKAIVPVHYAGIACDMDKIMALASKYDLYIIEDAAQAIDSSYKGQPLGSFGQMSAISFHETKNISSGEGGLLIINDNQYNNRAEIIWEKGTNRMDFIRGEVSKYDWIDIGSTYFPSEITAAFLLAQLENLEKVQLRRKILWNFYYELLSELEINKVARLPYIPDYSTNNAHMFYIVLNDADTRINLIKKLKSKGITAVFHFQSLHRSIYYKNRYDGRELPWSDMYSDCLLRLPMYYTLTKAQIQKICVEIKNSLF